MKTEIDNPPAFPFWNSDGQKTYALPGMSLRDYFAARSMQAQLMSQENCMIVATMAQDEKVPYSVMLARIAFDHADAMLLERSKKPTIP